MDVRRRVGANIKRLRLEQGLSQEELADRSGLHRTYLSSVERAVKNPTITVLARIADGLGTPLTTLVAEWSVRMFEHQFAGLGDWGRVGRDLTDLRQMIDAPRLTEEIQRKFEVTEEQIDHTVFDNTVFGGSEHVANPLP
jgi:transcriptional regulator with XRE-family HTH domain